MYSYEDRIRAIELYIKLGERVRPSPLIRYSMSFKDEPKNPRLSIHNKYKRRLNSLALAVDDFLHHADMKLDPAAAGKINKRAEIAAVVAKCRELAALLPDPADAINAPPVRADFLEVLQESDGGIDKILANADAFMKSLTPEEWNQIRAEYSKTD